VGEIEKAMMSEGFAGPLGNGLPCRFRKRITMGARRCRLRIIMKARAKQRRLQTRLFRKMKRRAFLPLAGARASANTSGPDPTDKKSPVKLRTSSGPHRTKKICFSSAGPAWIGASAFPKFDPAV
jgi:hypothetical protein